uniref:Phospholipase A2 n=1 Tax=Sciurus vulgaris TaxID=55149 RepID=A0A8D2AKA2_SCIVU
KKGLFINFLSGLMWAQGDIVNFHTMISLVTRKNAASSYGFYGCHCGLGGKGAPRDATDRCCAAHDCCYYRLEKRGCGTKLLKYKFKYRGGKVVCEGKKEPRSQSNVPHDGRGAEEIKKQLYDFEEESAWKPPREGMGIMSFGVGI